MSKHTPGPWVAVEIGLGGPADASMPVYAIQSADGQIAEYVDGKNAPILAAAPDLLSAGVGALAVLDQLIKDVGGCEHGVGVCMCAELHAADALRAALTKAAPRALDDAQAEQAKGGE